MAKAVRKSTPAVKKPAAVTFLDPELAPDLYALLVAGDCMAPLHPAGSAVLIDKREPYQGGDLIVIYMKPETVKAGHLNVMIKRLVSMPPWVKGFPYRENPKSEVHALATVEMLNPAQRVHFRCSDILAIHRCLGAVPADVRLISPLASAAHASDVTERLTRRGIVRSVLVGSAASLIAVSAASAFGELAPLQPDAALFDLEKQFEAAVRHADVISPLYARAEEAMYAWKDRNPQPQMRKCHIGTNAEYDLWAKQVATANHPSEVTAPNPNADLNAAISEHLDAKKQWRARKQTAKANCRFNEIEADWNGATDEISRILEEIADIPATTWAGLKIKARIRRHKDAASDTAVAESIVDDVLAMSL